MDPMYNASTGTREEVTGRQKRYRQSSGTAGQRRARPAANRLPAPQRDRVNPPSPEPSAHPEAMLGPEVHLHPVRRVLAGFSAQLRRDHTDPQAPLAGARAPDLDGELQAHLVHGESQIVTLTVGAGRLQLVAHLTNHL